MKPFTISHLESIAHEVIGDRDIVLDAAMTAADVPGWDSLNHTLISIEIAGQAGVDVDAQQLSALPNFGALVEFVRQRQG